MDSKGFHALADRCRDLARTAARADTREQLRQWADDSEAEAKAAEADRAHSALDNRHRQGLG